MQVSLGPRVTFVQPGVSTYSCPQQFSGIAEVQVCHLSYVSSHFCFCLPHLLPRDRVPYRMVLSNPSDLKTYTYRFSDCSILFWAGRPLQEVALLQSLPNFSVLCCPCPYCSLTASSLQRRCGLPTDLTPITCHSVLLGYWSRHT